uniref:POU domain, class 5, transcription factor 3 n=1 Tax=Haplochromis burtoni TaxID=8153 RepID=A0A3Q2US96_HAPBU
MSESPEGHSRPYDFSRTSACAQLLGQEGFGSSASFQVPHGVLPDPSRIYNKSCYSGIASTSAQAFFPFPSVSTDYRPSELQAGDFGQPKHWYPFADYTGQLPGVSAAIQPINLTTPEAETAEQIKLPEIKMEKVAREDYSSEMKIQQYLTPQASNDMAHGLFYARTGTWNPSFWSFSSPGSGSQTPSTSSTSSPSLSPSPPSNGLPGNGYFSVNTPQVVPEAQQQRPATSRRNAASSNQGCKEERETVSTEELEQFARELKHKRITLGFTQSDVGLSLGSLYGKMFSQTTICRFEALFKQPPKLKQISQSVTLHPSYMFLLPQMYKIERVFVDTRKRKRRTSLEGAVRAALESYFIKCPKPNTQAIKHISDDLGLERDVVRVWFCNRRQKGKRLALPLDEELEGQLYEQSPSPIPSQAYPGPSFTGGPPPTLYMPQLPRPDVMKQALNPGVVGHPTR